MCYPVVRQLGFDVPPDGEPCWREHQRARGIALDVRRREELERQRPPAAADHPGSMGDDRRSHAARRYAAVVFAIVLAIVIVYAVAPSGGVS